MEIAEPVASISVIIPCYRCSSTIRRALDSVLSQSLVISEIILVEDCSGDETLTTLQDLQRAHPLLVKIVKMEGNRGAASARNAGWAIASQSYIAFLDADDSWHPDKLRIQYEYMRNNPEIALSGHQCVFLSDEIQAEASKSRLVRKISAHSLLFKNAFSTPTVMVARDVPIRFQEGKRCAEDMLLWQQIAFSGLKVARIECLLAYVHKPLYGAGGVSAQLWKMEKGELNNFIVLYRAGNINFLIFSAAMFFSVAKFIKRVLLTKIRSLSKFLPCRGVFA
jgi:glycosyltransferase involved in cell wall biosynthesis